MITLFWATVAAYPVVISAIAVRHGQEGGISLAALFALLMGMWIWLFPETRGKKLED